MTSLDDIRECSVYMLAESAGCASPDNNGSEGAQLLDSVRCDVVAGIESGSITLRNLDDDGQLHAIADGAPSVFTATLWAQFVDLGAYNEDPEFDDEWPSDLNKTAAVALFQIADRLAHGLAEEWRGGWECPTCGEGFNGFGSSCDQDECIDPEAVEEARKRDALVAMVAQRAEDAAVEASQAAAAAAAESARIEAETDSDMRRMDALRAWHDSDVRAFRVLTWSAAAVLAVVAAITVVTVML